MQLIQSVREAMRLGQQTDGHVQTKGEIVVEKGAFKPNTVLKAYRELEYECLVTSRPGVGTFVVRTLTDESLPAHGPLREELRGWLARARAAGLDAESIEALFATTFRTLIKESA